MICVLGHPVYTRICTITFLYSTASLYLERNSAAAHARKLEKYTYTALKLDLEERGYTCMLVPFEIGSRGHLFKQTRLNLINIFVINKLRPNAYKTIKDVSKISLLCSFSIFHAFSQLSWQNPPFLEP